MGSMGSVRLRTSSLRLPCIRGARSMLSPGRVTKRRSNLHASWASNGRALRIGCHRCHWMPRFSLPRWGRWSRRLSPLCAKGGVVVCAGIHMSQIPTFSYSLLWGERSICSVANLTRQDGIEFMAAAAQQRLVTSVETFPLVAANEALARLRCGEVKGAAVLTMEQAQT